MRCSKGVVLANVLFQFGATDVDLNVMCSTLLVTKCSAHAHRQSPKVEGRSPKEEGRKERGRVRAKEKRIAFQAILK